MLLCREKVKCHTLFKPLEFRVPLHMKNDALKRLKAIRLIIKHLLLLMGAVDMITVEFNSSALNYV